MPVLTQLAGPMRTSNEVQRVPPAARTTGLRSGQGRRTGRRLSSSTLFAE
jgi:hypothetical protein